MQILGINQPGSWSGNEGITAGRELPWLQDTLEVNAMGAWGVTFRDVVVLDPDNRVLVVYNLTVHDLSLPENYAELREILLAAAEDFAP